MTARGTLPGLIWANAESGIIVSAPVLTAEPLDAVLLPVLPMEFDAWLRAAFAVVEVVAPVAPAAVEHAPLVVEAVTIVDAAGVAVDEVIGEKVEDDVLFVGDPVDAEVVVTGPSTAVGRLSDEAGELADAVVIAGDEVDVGEVAVEDGVAAVANTLDADVAVVAVLLVGVIEDEAVAEAGEQAVSVVAVAVGGPETVPAAAFVVCVPLAVPPDVLTKTALRISAFCQYCGAASITT